MNYKELATFVSYEVKDWALHLTASKLSALCVCVLSAIFVAGDPSQTWTLKSPRHGNAVAMRAIDRSNSTACKCIEMRL